jgi:hypothetical protein
MGSGPAKLREVICGAPRPAGTKRRRRRAIRKSEIELPRLDIHKPVIIAHAN